MSLNITLDALPVSIQDLPEVTSLSENDILVVNKNGSFTGKVTVGNLTQHLINYVSTTTYAADNSTIELISPGNIFGVKDSGITIEKLSPDIRDILAGNDNVNPSGSTLTGTLTTFTSPVTATGDFIIVNIDNQYKAIRIWNFA
jgi:hypothetical protein